MSYTLIAYKPDSEEYCKGCFMRRWSSSYHTHVFGDDEVDKLIEKAADYHHTNTLMSRYEEGYTISIIKGKPIIEEGCYKKGEGESLNIVINAKLKKMVEKDIEIKQMKELKKREKKLADKKRKIDEKEQKDRREFERLKKKYEMTT